MCVHVQDGGARGASKGRGGMETEEVCGGRGCGRAGGQVDAVVETA